MTSLAHPRSSVGRVFEHRYLQYRRTYRATIFSSFLTPILFLGAMGLGLGTYVDDGSGQAALGGVPYLQFLAPGLLVATCMQAAAFESAFPMMAGLRWSRIFHAMYAAPISGPDVALGNLAWIGARMLLVASVFTIVIVAFGAAASPLIVLAIPVGALTGLAFAAPIMAFCATQKTPERFNAVFRFGITPLFLFSGTFYPVESLPTLLQPLAWITPLWHGVALARGLSLGTIGEEPLLAVAHLAILLAFVVVGTWLAIRTVTNALVKG
ncbi:MAG TPA: ABC transporter permease [Candidatus Saccharimonadales bacterium]|nr:ABC transporter permease [Candidatus Saccharimonadales bacterium]